MVIVAVEEDRVWVQSTCITCRTSPEGTFIVELGSATDDPLRSIQFQAEMPVSPLLRTAAAWRAAVADWKPRRR